MGFSYPWWNLGLILTWVSYQSPIKETATVAPQHQKPISTKLQNVQGRMEHNSESPIEFEVEGEKGWQENK